MDKAIIIGFQLLLAHVLTDSIIQGNSWVYEKQNKKLKSKYFYIHILIAGLTTYISLHQWTNWYIPLFILITHGLIDYIKIILDDKGKKQNIDKGGAKKISEIGIFLFDQGLHLFVLLIAWLFLVNGFDKVLPFVTDLITDKNSIALITSFIIVIWPMAILIGKATAKWRAEIEAESPNQSLAKAGMYIGILERILVLIFILLNQYAAIGFLIAGKSLLRISSGNDKSGRKKTEYVLIGTLLSFTITIVIGLILQRILK